MQLNKSQLTELCALAESAATEAGKLISGYAHKKFSAQSKKGGDSYASQVFTEVDLLSQELILKTLEPSIKKYDLGLLSEEVPDDNSRFEKDYFWCIDPLDGTLPFIERTNGYSVSIALVAQSGIPQLGVVFDPTTQNLYSAIKEQGAKKNGNSWAHARPNSSTHKPLTFICDRSFLEQEKFQEVIQFLEETSKELGYDGLKIIKHGGAAMNACWVIEHAPACYFKFPKKQDGGGSIWDYASTACIFKELRANATDIEGKILNLNQQKSTFMNSKGVLFASSSIIAKHILSYNFSSDK